MDESLLSKARILFNPYNIINNAISIFCYQVGRHIPLPQSPSNTTAEQPQLRANIIPASKAFDLTSRGLRGASSFCTKPLQQFPSCHGLQPRPLLSLNPWKLLHRHSLWTIPEEEETNTLARQQSWSAYHPH